MRNIIISRLNGGLGNQMFQYSIGRAISFHTDRELYLETGDLDRDTLRQCQIHNFDIKCTLVDEEFLAKRLLWPIKLVKRIPNLPFPFSRIKYIREKSFEYDKGVFDLSGDVCLEGYWQSPKYFVNIKKDIYNEFRISKLTSPYRISVSHQILNGNSVSIHIRRGDYISNPKTNSYHGTCSVLWYNRAMEIIQSKFKDINYFVFSDDLNWAKENIHSRYPINFVENQSDGKDYEDLYIMSLCKHNIIANSSFSWWSAWLNRNPEKVVICPQDWFSVKHINTKDLIPDEWIKLD
ncbi:alpha-1,2-fucosyltransferase [Thalassospira xiamenensis]|uniref:alpha-1,2-fucosyltransferase n=1 Tax=Thalassospira xiamenensis TaxID=220697 RepID=UPI003AA9115E